ncbi:MAG: ORF6N domain-containing protein [Verrucomicrobiia bacterium]
MAAERASMISLQRAAMCIHEVRNQRVIIDADLARIYGVTTKRPNEAVKRNRDRFPSDFAFQLTRQEVARLRSQIATASKRNIRFLPYAFTEHGAIMAATVLNSPQSVRMSLFVVRAFVKMRDALGGHRELARKLDELEGKYDAQFKVVFEAIRQLMRVPEPPRKQIGFHVRERNGVYRVRKNGGRH